MKTLLIIFCFIIFVFGKNSNENDKTPSCNIKKRDPHAVTLISTIDGMMIAVNTITGNELWRYKDKPLLETPKTINKNFLFLPNPQDGNLFVYTENKLKRLPFTIPQLVQASPCKTSDGIFYAGAKKDVWLSIHFERGLQSEEIRNSLDQNICPVSKDELVYIGRSEYQLVMKNSTNNNVWNVTYYDYTSYIPIEDDDKPSIMYLSKPGSGKIICIDTESKTIMWEKKFPSVIIDTFHLRKDGLHFALNRFVGSETLEAFIEASMTDTNMYNALYNTILSDLNKNEIKSQYYEPSLYIGRSNMAMYAIPTYISTIFDKKEIIIDDRKERSIGYKDKDGKEINYTNENKNQWDYELSVGYHEIPKLYASELIPVINDINSKISMYNNKRLPYFKLDGKGKKKQKTEKSKRTPRIIELIEDKMNEFEVDNWIVSEFLHIIWIKHSYLLIFVFLSMAFSIAVIIVFCIFKIIRKSSIIEHSVRTNSAENSRISNTGSFGSRDSKSNWSYFSMNDGGENNESILIDGHFTIGKLQYDPKIILGRGCEGTVVYRGTFEGRNVAVKRVLSDLVKITNREINMLRESDSHVNVIRYFCSESDRTFKYIALELCDCSLASYVDNQEYRDIMCLDNLEILRQATEGVAHLHHLDIVHRDIKPQNILLSKNAQTGYVRVLISDFGLCKRLKINCNSISRVSGMTGTEGWMAPETVNSEASVTVAVDIFALGCIYYYVLSKGKHPFGDTIKRQDNIIHGRFNLELITENDVAMHLIEAMIHNMPLFRPSAVSVLSHPMFWSNDRKLQFFMDVSDRIEIETEGNGIVGALEKNAHIIISRNWRNIICKYLAEDLRKFRSYKHDTVRDLLRAMRNKKHHYRELPTEVKESLGDIPDHFLQYFTSRFPKLLLHVYRAMKLCKSESVFQGYYLNTHTAFFKEPFDHLPDINDELDTYTNPSIFVNDNINNFKTKDDKEDNNEPQNFKNQSDKKIAKVDGNNKKGGYVKRRKPFQSNK